MKLNQFFNYLLFILLLPNLFNCKCDGTSQVYVYLENKTSFEIKIDVFIKNEFDKTIKIVPNQKILVGDGGGMGLFTGLDPGQIGGDSVVLNFSKTPLIYSYERKNLVNGIPFDNPNNFLNRNNYKVTFDKKTKCNWVSSSTFIFTNENLR